MIPETQVLYPVLPHNIFYLDVSVHITLFTTGDISMLLEFIFYVKFATKTSELK